MPASLPVLEALIIRTTGSTPAACGTSMIKTAAGTWIGTLGGGHLEWLVQTTAGASRTACHLTVDLNPDNDQCCGGRVEVALIPIPQALAPLYATPADRLYLRARDGCLRLQGGRCGTRCLGTPPDDNAAMGWDKTQQIWVRLMPKGRPVWLFGAGHVARAIAHCAIGLDLTISVCDERPEWLEAQALAHTTRYAHFPTPADKLVHTTAALLIMTHSHELDYRLLTTWATAPVHYLGVIGSQTKAARFRHALARDGIAIPSLHMPIGLVGLGKRPAEIAISVLAELLATPAHIPNPSPLSHAEVL